VAHGHINRRRFQRQGVIHAIPCHHHNGALRILGLHDAQFVLGRDARVDGDPGDALGEFLIAHAVQLAPNDDRISRRQDVECTGDRPRRIRVITSNHHDANASALTPLECIAGFIAWRILQAYQPQEGQAVLDVIGIAHLMRHTG
jgi:hypothetical protein